jgi:light-regulated signal transduction histidine kinase (bacteriophytochrome)
LELEEKPASSDRDEGHVEIYASLKSILADLQATPSLSEFFRMAAAQVRQFTGFDRVMIYKFLEDGSGKVVAEDKRADLEAYLGLHYPASDIPKQARALYVKSWLRMKSDNDAAPVPIVPSINPLTNAPLDMSYAVLRSMSPIHTEYLRNMGVRATMSISIIQNNQLWGLVACHHYTPRYVNHPARMACEFLAHMLSLQVGSKEALENHEYIKRLTSKHAEMVRAMSDDKDFFNALLKPEADFEHWLDAQGVAFCIGDEVALLGATPPETDVRQIVAWLLEHSDQEVFATNNLAAHYTPANEFPSTAAGLLAARLAKLKPQYVLWFRPEIAQEVHWAGDPTKPVEVDEFDKRLTPRKSFALWIEEVQGKSAPWKDCEVDAARALRRSILEIVGRKAEELSKLNAELERSNLELDSFALITSHDLKEPLRGIHNYSQLLIESYGDQLDDDAQQQLQTLMLLTQRMESLIESLLYYSRVGRAELRRTEVNLNNIVSETLEMMQLRLQENNAQVYVNGALPNLHGDAAMLREVFANLIGNAVKYNDKLSRKIEVGHLAGTGVAASAPILYVRDNGIGMDAKHHNDIFHIFRRLHGHEQYGGGIGAGLTITKKIVERHGGRIWVESTPGAGSTFYFTLQPEHE